MSADQIKALRIKRGRAKSSLTSYENFLKKYNPEEDLPVLEKRFKEIEITRETFLALQAELELLEEDSDDLMQYQEAFEEAYFEAYKTAHKLLFPRPASQTLSETPSTITEISTQSQSATVTSPEMTNQILGQINVQNQNIIAPSSARNSPPEAQISVNQTPVSQPAIIAPNYAIESRPNLPTITLPTFSGRFDEWLGFYDLFHSMIHEDESVVPVRKLFYLKGCLTGEAADVIASIESSASNYEVAWKLLTDRYDDRKVIRESYVQALLDIPSISRECSIRAFLDQLQKYLRALKRLGEPINTWNSMLIVILRNKFPTWMRERWEEHTCGNSTPTIEQLINFLTKRAHLESVRVQTNNKSDAHKMNTRSTPQTKQVFSASVEQRRCLNCHSNEHYISACNAFLELNPYNRLNLARKQGLCTNCLRNNHQAAQCTSSKCRKCGQRHNTLLHFEKSYQKGNHTNNSGANNTEPNNSVTQEPSSRVALHAIASSEALLATALVDIVSPKGLVKTCKVFLDAGSQAHFITESTARFLKLDRTEVNISVSGVDDLCTNIKHAAHATLKSRYNNFSKTIEFLIVPQISKAMPSAPIDRANLKIPKNIVLADPEFYNPSTVDALLGVGLFYKLLSVGQIILKDHPEALLQKTQLGWVVAGSLNHSFNKPTLSCHLAFTNQSFDLNLTRFWEMEELPQTKLLSQEEQLCENHFRLNTTRTSTGRYMVRLPFNDNVHKLGNSYNSALRRFLFLEKRLVRDPVIKTDYTDFLKEYEDLGHMSPIDEPETERTGFYLPHHAVVKQDSITTKTRVVFDASAKTTSGLSLNDTLMVGPKLQDDLFTILIRFRVHIIVLTADIEKMYRQILVHPDDIKYQKILFRSDPTSKIRTFTLNTVSYGTSSAPYLAVRSLFQLADDEGHAYPLAAVALRRDFYVDDLLTDANSRQEAERLRDEINELTKKGGFTLRKWASNDASLVKHSDTHPSTTHMSLDPEAVVKALGIHWNAKEDSIFYSVNISKEQPITKRSILSQIAKLFDPLGLLGPVIVYAKILLQSLWKAGLAWDESIPLDLYTAWETYLHELPLIESTRFTRCITRTHLTNVQIHGFCDASEKAYGACLYLRVTDTRGIVQVNLICSKSRVTPVSCISLPRLELCGALLLSRLLYTVRQSLSINIDDIILWCDSTITLHWLNTPPHRLKTFVANRVAEVQRLTNNYRWRHVPSPDNPADLISRGQLPSEFIQGKLWKTGPGWLTSEQSSWPENSLSNVELPDIKIPGPQTTTCMKLQLRGYDLIERDSAIDKTIRMIAYLRRFIQNARREKAQRVYNSLNLDELIAAEETVVKMVQENSFTFEIKRLKNGSLLPDNSKLLPLSPFLDAKGLLRVGGRLSRSDLPDGQRHPILLPGNHNITRAIIRREHERHGHAGAQATLYAVRQTYWPLDSRNVTRKIIHQCFTCFRAKPRLADHITGDLPSYRVSQSRPFLHVGIDFCGPLYMKEKRHRNRQKLKVYVAVYVCMSTKAVHLELVTDLTTEAFIASLKRFFARRGISSDIYSDNGTNFVGANRELQELYELFQTQAHNSYLQDFMHQRKIKWHFIPPRAPHFGGLWEAAVKSFKKHFLRTVGDTLLTYDQLETFIIEIEAILNSRPISPLSSDPNDPIPMTPGHFLIGSPLTSFPQVDFTDTPSNRLSAWEHAQQMKQHFWQRWYKEYLHQLITRPATPGKPTNLEIDTLVLIAEDNLPPLRWLVGRITAVHPGKDGIVRTATVRTAKGTYERCTKRLCPLPSD